MKGILLAGGLGTRLRPLTNVTNKHILPVGDCPMIYHPLRTLHELGIREVLIVVGGQSTEEILKLVKDGKWMGFDQVYYAFQEKEDGIGGALALGEKFAAQEPITVILGDNIFRPGVFRRYNLPVRVGARVVLVRVPDARQYGNPAFYEGSSRIKEIVEKPETPRNSLAVSGLYFYDKTVFDRLRELRPSERGEIEVTALNNSYARVGASGYEFAVPESHLLFHTELFDDVWGDAGSSIEGWMEVSAKVNQWRRESLSVGDDSNLRSVSA